MRNLLRVQFKSTAVLAEFAETWLVLRVLRARRLIAQRVLTGVFAAICLVALLAPRPHAAGQAEQDLVARARAIHDRVITLDTHNDIDPLHFTPACNYTMRLTTQVNLPKMKEGGVDVSFMVVYVGQSNPPQTPDAFQPSGYERAYREAVRKFDAVHALTEKIAPAHGALRPLAM